jgi:hypothetical protein
VGSDHQKCVDKGMRSLVFPENYSVKATNLIKAFKFFQASKLQSDEAIKRQSHPI